MKSISVITPTARGKKGLELVEKALKQQTFQNFEWLVQDKTPVKKGNVWSLNHDYNLLVKRAKYPLLVSWQDYTYAKPDTLERFYNHFKQEPKTLVTAVGNKYTDDSWTVMVWKDPRERDDLGAYYPCHPIDWEANLGSLPRQAAYDIGGWDEFLDKRFGIDNISVVERIDALHKYDFKIDQSVKSYSLEHGRPKDWDKKHAMHGFYEERKKAYIENPVLNYL